jgi:hypothetical protein
LVFLVSPVWPLGSYFFGDHPMRWLERRSSSRDQQRRLYTLMQDTTSGQCSLTGEKPCRPCSRSSLRRWHKTSPRRRYSAPPSVLPLRSPLTPSWPATAFSGVPPTASSEPSLRAMARTRSMAPPAPHPSARGAQTLTARSPSPARSITSLEATAANACSVPAMARRAGSSTRTTRVAARSRSLRAGVRVVI